MRLQAELMLPACADGVAIDLLQSLVDEINMLANKPERQCDLQIAIERCDPEPVAVRVLRSGAAAREPAPAGH